MRPETRRGIHYGINFVVSPLPELTHQHFLALQRHFAESALELVFDRVATQEGKLLLQRERPALQVTVGPAGPPAAPFAQVLIVSPNPGQLLDEFIDEAEGVVEAYHEVWPGRIQVVRRDSTIRHLYAVTGNHSFQFLWETRLRQSEGDLRHLNREVLGGGLRLVMPAGPEVQEDNPTVEVKIESYLRDSTQLFVETQFVWEQVLPQGARMDPRSLLEQVNDYAEGPVVDFITATGGPDAETA